MESLLLTGQFSEDPTAVLFKGNATTPMPSLPYCHPETTFLLFISQQLRTCIPTTLSFLSTVAGILSITSWLFAQLPQIITNHKLKSAEGLSFMFLLIWCLGDAGNLTGAVLLDQMTFQKVVATYYVAVDVVLVWQWWYYSRNQAPVSPIDRPADGVAYLPLPQGPDDRRPSGSGRFKEAPRATGSPPPKPRSLRPGNVFLTLSLLFNIARAAPASAPISTTSIHISFMDDETLTHIGTFLSWCSTFFYLSSRLPQIYLNHTRKSVSGLSPLLFFAAFCGNLFYSSSLLLNPSAWWNIEPFGEGGWVGEDGTTTAAFWKNTLPFLLGSAGVLAMDGYIGLQFWAWGGKEEGDNEVLRVIVGVEPSAGAGSQPVVVVSTKTAEDVRYSETSALLASLNGVYGTSAGSSSSSSRG